MINIWPRIRRAAVTAAVLMPMLAGCAHHQPVLQLPSLEVGHATFASTVAAYTGSAVVGGNRVDILLKEIGDTLGPFDLAALPIGSYTPRAIARPVHISPEEALQAWTDLRAARFIGVHWGTFMLAREPYDEPPARIAAEVARRKLDPEVVSIPRPGETLPW